MPDWDLSADVVIVGSGGGALCAALVAREQGLEPLVLEKTELVGGSTAMSGGGVWVPNSPLMQEAGVPDSAEEALRYFDAVVGDVGPASSPQRRRAYVETAPKLMAFLQQQGIPFRYAKGYPDNHPDAPGGMDSGRSHEALPYDTHRLGPWTGKLRPGSSTALDLIAMGTEMVALSYYNRHPRNLLIAARVQARTWAGKLRRQKLVSNGAALAGRLLELALEQGVDIRTDSPVQELVVTDGKVTGVVAQLAGRQQRIRARHAVLLAAGGYSRSNELRARHGGNQAHSAAWSSANPGDTGEVLQMAMDLGAATALLDEAIWLPGPRMADGAPPPPYPIRRMLAFSRLRWRPGTIIVDGKGQRFVNESGSFMDIGQAMFARDDEAGTLPSWLIFDDKVRRQSLFGVRPGDLPEQWISDGFLKRGDTLAEVAGQCGIDAAGLEATVERFNTFADSGVDADFGRGENAYDKYMGDPSHGPNNCLAPLRRGPYYAAALFPGDLATCGGVIADEHARVLSTDGAPIPGLYATGNMTASLCGRRYLGPGASIGPTCTFGFIAMHHIAQQAAEAG